MLKQVLFLQIQRSWRPTLHSMLAELEIIATGYPVEELAALANDLRICIATLGAVWSAEMKEKAEVMMGKGTASQTHSQPVLEEGDERGCGREEEQQTDTESTQFLESRVTPQPVTIPTGPASDGQQREELSPFAEALSFLKSSLLPSQAHGLIQLKKLIETREREAVSNIDTLTTIFKEHLRHEDSYIYLAAINGLVAVSSICPQKVLEILCAEYSQLEATSGAGLDRETGVLHAKQTLTTGRRRSEQAVQWRLKVGESLVKVVQGCGELLPQFSDLVLSAILSNVHDEDSIIRASSLSNLAEVCMLMKYSFTSVQYEVVEHTA